MEGSVFPMSSMVSLPPAIICAVMSYVHKHHDPIAEALDTDEARRVEISRPLRFIFKTKQWATTLLQFSKFVLVTFVV
eukprot:2870088-Amphidinium_carterae.2